MNQELNHQNNRVFVCNSQDYYYNKHRDYSLLYLHLLRDITDHPLLLNGRFRDRSTLLRGNRARGRLGSVMYPEGVVPSGTVFFGLCLTKKRMELLCASKHRVWSPKHRLVRNIPETFRGLGLPQQTAFCPQKAMIAGMLYFKLCS